MFEFWKRRRKKILVISGGGFKGVYALGVMKGLEELGIKEDIDAIRGVSAGALIGALWANGISAQEIFDELIGTKLGDFYSMNLITSGFKSLVSTSLVEKILDKNLPKNFSKLGIKLFVCAVDVKRGKFVVFDKGEMDKPILGSMAIPGVYPIVKYKDYLLMDGGIWNNFPVDLAKKKYSDHKIIGINLNKVGLHKTIGTFLDTMIMSYQVSIKARAADNNKFVDYLFYPELDVKVLDISKTKLKKAFERGYRDCMGMFG